MTTRSLRRAGWVLAIVGTLALIVVVVFGVLDWSLSQMGSVGLETWSHHDRVRYEIAAGASLSIAIAGVAVVVWSRRRARS